ncbi:MotA/TolQ/ExbB proton channel family protein [Roseinatronobacter alkalisoli]|uniref:MotA/TolQ/ExbB proton channel family protein n=1 Tax=Roseinatronobacter alkalisoli TaxID=3028235 RepID=A0ABT5TA17_9RHOB|nr:MotA/TolQ/ExbB proton channel family protein [Roseinatronobacter sp. HJB301]MDD7971951.1 MotA/TolQ/ExbB proton channel family protein [Roseinatronobacter sp. HJB301]
MQTITFQDFSALAWGILGLLTLMSVFALSVVLVKLVQFAQAGVGQARITGAVTQALAYWQAGEQRAARAQTEGGRSARSLRMQVLGGLFDTLSHPGASPLQAQARALQQASDGLETLSRNMRGLEGVVQAAPMLGLLGTVVGMIEAFGTLAATSGAADPAQLAGGIWTALVTTALGLAIAIVFYLVSLWLEGRIAAEGRALERMIGAVLQLTPAQPPAGAMSHPGSATPQPASSLFSATGAADLPPAPPAPPSASAGTLPPARHTIVQPMPGGATQRTDPGGYAPLPGISEENAHSAYADPGTGPAPEGFRNRR